MINALIELKQFIQKNEIKSLLVAAVVRIRREERVFLRKDIPEFLDYLHKINHDEGYGSQNLYGTLWFEDGTWADRGEYDGGEWWEYRKRPPIPLVGIDKETIGE